MLKVKAIALQVTNLSDARYFSAYGVDWMAFPSSRDADNISTIKEIVEWVEGPQIALELKTWDEEYYHFFQNQMKVDGLVVWNDPSKASAFNIVNIVTLAELPQTIAQTEELYLDTRNLEKEQILQAIKDYPQLGVALFGSHEDQVGFKSFDEQDEMIELLLD